MLTCTNGNEVALREALSKVVDHARNHEPGTISYYATQDQSKPQRFTTYERYQSEADMVSHNESNVVAAFFRVASLILAEPALVITGTEL